MQYDTDRDIAFNLETEYLKKCYEYSSFAKSMSRDIGEKVSKNLGVKYGQKSLDHTKQSATDALKTISRRKITKTAEATGDFFGHKIADRITKVSTTSPHNNYETITNKYDKEKTNEKYISPKEK